MRYPVFLNRYRWFGKARRGCETAPAPISRKARAQWPGRNRKPPLRFCAPEVFRPAQGVTPVMGPGADSPCQGEMARRARGGRVGEYEHEVLILSRPRRRFGDFAAAGKVTRRPQAAKFPLRTTNVIRNLSPHPSRLRRATFSPGGRLTGGHMGPPLQNLREPPVLP